MSDKIFTVQAAATITRPSDTTAYASGDLIANSTTAGSVTPFSFLVADAGGCGVIYSCRIDKSDATAAITSARMHFFTVSPLVANGDNGAFQPTLKAGYLGSYDLAIDRKFSDGYVGFGVASTEKRPFKLATDVVTLYGLLEARAAYTPVSAEVFTAYVDIYRPTF